MIEKFLGEKIKALRQEKKMTLEELSRKTGISKSVLSRIENYKISSPISTYEKIATALNVPIGYFFSEEHNPDFMLIKRGEDKEIEGLGSNFGHRYYSLGYKKSFKKMEPFLLIYPQRKDIPLFIHNNEEFIYLLEGRLEFIHGDQRVILEPGDCIYFNANIKHGGRTIGRKRAKVIAVQS